MTTDEINALRQQIDRLRTELAEAKRQMARQKQQIAELDVVREWHREIQTTTRAGKIAFAAVGALLGLIATVLLIINQWPRS